VNYNSYFEPFFGGGALYFSELPKKAFLSDLNEELINCYKQIVKNPYEVMEILKPMEYNEKEYYQIRSWLPENNIERASRFIYLNRCCWNGLYRVNKNGEFNVPIGKYPTPRKIFDKSAILNLGELLKNTKLSVGDFQEKTRNAKENDFIYFDPPYTVKHNNNGFVKYNESVFSWEDQKRLASHIEKLNDRGVKILISNANAKEIHELYNGFNKIEITRNSIISGTNVGRGKITEMLMLNYSTKSNSNLFNY